MPEQLIHWKTTNYPIPRQIIFVSGEPSEAIFCRQFSVTTGEHFASMTMLVTHAVFERLKFPPHQVSNQFYYGLGKAGLKQVLVDMAKRAAFKQWPKDDYFSSRNRREVLAGLLREIFGAPEQTFGQFYQLTPPEEQ